MAKGSGIVKAAKQAFKTRVLLPSGEEVWGQVISGAKGAGGTAKTAFTRKAAPSYSTSVKGKPTKTKPVYSEAAQAQNKAITAARLKVGGAAGGAVGIGGGAVAMKKRRAKKRAKKSA